jgi:hypothetical protein
MNTSVSVGIVPDELAVSFSLDGDITFMPPTHAFRVGALLMKAGLSSAAQAVSEDALAGIALMLDQLDKMLDALAGGAGPEAPSPPKAGA